MRPLFALDQTVLVREFHGHGRIVGAAFAPGFRQIALEQLHISDAIDEAATRVARQLLGEIGQHLGRDLRAQGREVFRRISRLDVAEQLFERIIVRLGDGNEVRRPVVQRCRSTVH